MTVHLILIERAAGRDAVGTQARSAPAWRRAAASSATGKPAVAVVSGADAIIVRSSPRDCRRARMGTWDVGPFNNDTAADWCGDLHDAAGDQRLPLVRAALSAVVDNDDKYLANRLADQAIAAAAVVASQLPGGEPLVTPYAPNFL